MTIELTPLAEKYVRSTNAHDAPAFIALFAENAVVNDAGREFRGLQAIKSWSDSDIFAANVTLEVFDATVTGNVISLTTKVEGDFDRTGLPDPVVINHRIKSAGGKITELTCSLAEG